MKLRKNQLKPLRFDSSGALNSAHGIEASHIHSLLPRLSELRDGLLNDTSDADASAFIRLPERLLTEYSQHRQTGVLGRIFQRANRIQASTDRMIVLGNGSVCLGPRVILETCCQPYWNELSRGERGSKPRIYFDEAIPDNDAAQALLYLVSTNRNRYEEVEQNRWGLVVLSPGMGHVDLAHPVLLEPFVDALIAQAGGDACDAAEQISGVTYPTSGLDKSLASLRMTDVKILDSMLPTPFTALSPIGLLPAAILGVNVMELVQGAAWMTEHFAQAPEAENIVFQIAAIQHLLKSEQGIRSRHMRLWNAGLVSFGEWYSDLVAAILCEPCSWVKKVASKQSVLHVIVESPRFDPLAVGELKLPQILASSIDTTDAADRASGLPTTKLFIPILDELHVGQLLQLMMLATVLESKLRDGQ